MKSRTSHRMRLAKRSRINGNVVAYKKMNPMKTFLLLGLLATTSCISFGPLNSSRNIEQRMRQEIIAECEFRDAHVRDVVGFMNHPVDDVECDPSTQVILVLPKLVEPSVPLIVLQAKNISRYDVAVVVAELTGLKFSIQDGHPWLKYENNTLHNNPSHATGKPAPDR